jgi:hypothetical protein
MNEFTPALNEMTTAAWVGAIRALESKTRGLKDSHGFSEDCWDLQIEGAGGELAVAKALNVYWDGSVNTLRAPDLSGIQVRTRSQRDYDLIVWPDDSPDDLYVLVTGQMPEYRIHGWIRGSDAMQDRWLKEHGDRPPAYFVPQDALQPIETLLHRETN